MTASFGSISNTTYASRTNTTTTAPTGITNGDRLILFQIVTGTTPPTPTQPAGFSALPGTWPKDISSAGFHVQLYAWSKVASGESGDYTATHTACASQGVMMRVTGADATNPFSPTPVLRVNAGSEEDTVFTTLTSTADGALFILFMFDFGDDTSDLAAPTGTNPTFTERLDVQLGIVFVATGELATAGAMSDRTMANRANLTNPWAGVTIVVEPDTGGGTTIVSPLRVMGPSYAAQRAASI